jgi:DNA-binding MarR family transcriptional regulator
MSKPVAQEPVISNSAHVRDAKLKSLAGHLLRVSHLRAQRIFFGEAGQDSMTSLQAGILIAIGENSHIEHRQLAKLLHVTKPILTTALKPLFVLLLIQRSTSKLDARVSMYTLTQKGCVRVEELRHAFNAAENRLLKKLSDEDKVTLLKLLSQIT